jgi:hypothetical protein
VPREAPNEFFVMSQSTATSLIEDELKRLQRPDDYPVTGIVWDLAAMHKDKWEILPR